MRRPGPGSEGPRGASGRARHGATAGSGLRAGPGIAVFLAMLSALAAAALPVRALGQEVVFRPRPDRPEERRLERFLERRDYRLWTRDTVLAAGDTVRGSVLVLEATVRSAAVVRGDVYVVGGDLFLRPDGRIEGDAVVLAGGYYASGLSTVTGETLYRPNLLLRVVPREGGYEIFHVAGEPERLTLDGLGGFHLPAYRRVDGWTLGWGAELRATEVAWQPTLAVDVRFHTEGPDKLEGTVRNDWHPTGALRVGIEAGRRTRTNDEWIRGDVANTLSYFSGLGDFRNYFRSKRATFDIDWNYREGFGASLALHAEEAETLSARPLAVLFEDDRDVRPNPAIDEGTIWSLEPSVSYRRRTVDSRLVARAGAEAADADAAGDFSFVLGEALVGWRRPGFAPGHRIELFGIGRVDVSGTAPRQRWSAIGGTGTFPTLDVLQLRGPRLGFLSATYVVPLESLRMAVLGAPRVFVRNALGSAWSEEDPAELEDNVVAGVRFVFVEAGVAVDVTRSEFDPSFVLGGSFPSRFWR